MAWKRNSVRALVVMFIMSIVAMSMMSGSVALSDSVESKTYTFYFSCDRAIPISYEHTVHEWTQ